MPRSSCTLSRWAQASFSLLFNNPVESSPTNCMQEHGYTLVSKCWNPWYTSKISVKLLLPNVWSVTTTTGKVQLQTCVPHCHSLAQNRGLCTDHERVYTCMCLPAKRTKSTQGCCWQFSAVKVAVKSRVSLKSGSLNLEMRYKDVFKKDEWVSF